MPRSRGCFFWFPVLGLNLESLLSPSTFQWKHVRSLLLGGNYMGVGEIQVTRGPQIFVLVFIYQGLIWGLSYFGPT